jgi:S1-C subfamily serine protease
VRHSIKESDSMRTHLLIAAFLLLPINIATASGPADSIVKVVSQVRPPNPIRPWIRQGPVELSGTGIVLDGRRILTCAHLVNYAREVTVQGRDGGRRVEAKVQAIGPGIDLAILAPTEPDFLRDRPPLPRAEGPPAMMATVLVYGYPVGGAGLSITKGIVSRVGFAAYDEHTFGLRLQVDAAINPGNSGGPALVDGKSVGLAFAQLDEAQRISYILPNEEIDAFLQDVRDGRYDGKPMLSSRLQFQVPDNEALRGRLGLSRDVGGMLVCKVGTDGPCCPLREFDVLTHLGGQPIDREGMVRVRDGLRLPFLYLVPALARDGAVPARVWRSGETLELALPAGREDDRLIRELDGHDPSYFVYGPLVFSPVVGEAASAYFQLNPRLMARSSPILTRATDRIRFPGEELVAVTTPLLPHPIGKGYGDPIGQVIASVDGVAIRNLRQLVGVLRDGRSEYVTIRFADEHSETLVFRRREIEAATSEVMAENGIPRRATADALGVWNGKPSAER